MEWYGEKMLPRGLPELVYQVAPPEIVEDLKVISFNKREKKGVMGRVRYDDNYYRIQLYPTVIISNGDNAYSGTQSFCYWLGFLRTMLHEIGHIVTESIIPRVCWQGYEHNSCPSHFLQKLSEFHRSVGLKSPSGMILTSPFSLNFLGLCLAGAYSSSEST